MPSSVSKAPPTQQQIDMRTLCSAHEGPEPPNPSYPFYPRTFTERTPYPGMNQWGTVVAADAPIGWWKLEEQTGDYVDSVAARNAVVFTTGGVTRNARGAPKGSLAYRGNGTTGNYAQTAEYAAYKLGLASFSMECWIKYTKLTFTSFYCVRTSNPGTAIQGIFTTGRINPGDIAFELWAWQNPESRCRTSKAYNDGEWHHVVGTYTRTEDKARLWIDGKLEDTRAQGNDAAGNLGTAYSMTIGANVSNIQHLPGSIDEVLYYDKALSQSRIEQHYVSERW